MKTLNLFKENPLFLPRPWRLFSLYVKWCVLGIESGFGCLDSLTENHCPETLCSPLRFWITQWTMGLILEQSGSRHDSPELLIRLPANSLHHLHAVPTRRLFFSSGRLWWFPKFTKMVPVTLLVTLILLHFFFLNIWGKVCLCVGGVVPELASQPHECWGTQAYLASWFLRQILFALS